MLEVGNSISCSYRSLAKSTIVIIEPGSLGPGRRMNTKKLSGNPVSYQEPNGIGVLPCKSPLSSAMVTGFPRDCPRKYGESGSKAKSKSSLEIPDFPRLDE